MLKSSIGVPRWSPWLESRLQAVTRQDAIGGEVGRVPSMVGFVWDQRSASPLRVLQGYRLKAGLQQKTPTENSSGDSAKSILHPELHFVAVGAEFGGIHGVSFGREGAELSGDFGAEAVG